MPRGELDRARQEGRLVGMDPQRITGIIDTAAQKTFLQANVVDKLLLDPIGYGPVHSALGRSESPIFAVTIQLAWKLQHRPDPIPVNANVLPEILGADVLIGLDVLRLGKLVVFGPENRYELMLPRTTHSPN